MVPFRDEEAEPGISRASKDNDRVATLSGASLASSFCRGETQEHNHYARCGFSDPELPTGVTNLDERSHSARLRRVNNLAFRQRLQCAWLE